MTLADLVIPPWLRALLWAVPAAVIAGLVAALLITRATLHDVRQQAKIDAAQRTADDAKRQAAFAEQARKSADDYAARTAALQPLIIRSKDTVTNYAQTPAGRAPCAAADRVSGIDQLDASLFAAAATAPGGAGAVPADAGASPGGRLGQQR